MENVKSKITILSVGKPYRMVNETTAEVNEGCTVWYITRDGFPAFPIKDDDGGLGLVPAKATMPPAFYHSAKECGIPCVADCEFTWRIKGGGVTLKPVAIELPNSAIMQMIPEETRQKIEDIHERYSPKDDADDSKASKKATK